MRRILNWAGAGLIAVVGIGGGWASLYFLISPFFHFSEPAFAERLVPENEAIVMDRDVDHRLTAALEQRFPPGTKESQLKIILYLQGFRSVLPLPVSCDIPVPNDRSAICDDEDVNQTLKYIWHTGIKCRHAISVRWTANSQAELRTVNGYYRGGGCLPIGR
jgi:hypothetical protein